jgi:hypothetical protein
MRNQLPPILDVAMVAIDPNSIVRFGTPATLTTATGTLGGALLVPTNLFGGPITAPTDTSANMDADLATYGTQLSNAHVRYHIFRASIQMEGAAWVNN